MEFYKDEFSFPHAKKPWRIVIVGAGIAGLTSAIALKKAGHDVLILEQVHQIAEVGAGIQIAPNASRILGRLGLLEKILEKSSLLTTNSTRRWEDNRQLGSIPLMPLVGQRYNAPLASIHRADLQNILLQAARDHQIPLRLNAKVVDTDPNFAARVKLADGSWVEGDIILAADGVKSHIRSQILAHHGVNDEALPTGDAAYRLSISRDQLQHNEYALSLLDGSVGMRWLGPGSHIMGYPIRNNLVYNMVLLHPQKPNTRIEDSWTTKGDKAEMIDLYKAWCPEVRDLISCVPNGEIMEWTLNTHQPLPTWHENRIVLAGDACHPMLPYVAQGAAQAIEDAGVLTCVLSMIDDSLDIGLAFEIYEAVRKDRGEVIQQSAAKTRETLHLPDGPAQVERDESIAGQGKTLDLWVDHEWQDFMWGLYLLSSSLVTAYHRFDYAFSKGVRANCDSGVDITKDIIENWDNWIAKSKRHHLVQCAN